jgi:hypothetical protein
MKPTDSKPPENRPAELSAFPGPEAMEQGVSEPCVFCQVLYPARLAAHCPHCGDRRMVFRPARMMSRELAAEHLAALAERCRRMEEALHSAKPEARPKALSELRRCQIGLLRDKLTYGVGESKPLIDRIHALDAEIGAAGVE